MQRKFRYLIPLFALLASPLLCQAQTPDVGQKAPAFSLNTPDGKTVGLVGLMKKGPVVLIVLRGYPGYQCPYCVRQVHDYIENAGKFAVAGAEIMLVYPGPPAELDQHAKEFLVKQNPLPSNVHLVIDPDYNFTNQYGLRWDAPHETAYPSTFLISRDKTVLFEKVSKTHGDRTAAVDVLAELEKSDGKQYR